MVKKAAQAIPNQLLRRARLERGWTQKVVADRIGAPNDMMVTRWERGTASPSAYYIERLCQLFEQRASDLGLLPEAQTFEPSPEALDLVSELELKQQPDVPLSPASQPVAAFLIDPAIPQVTRNGDRIVGRAGLLQQLKQLLAQVAFAFARNERLLIPELDAHTGVELLAHYVPSLVKESPQDIDHLVRTVGGLPLALTLLGHYLAAQALAGQPRRLQTALARLHERQHRFHISMPVAGSERSPALPLQTPLSLHTAIALSTQMLDPEAFRVFCALCVFPAKPASFSEEAALAVTQCSLETLDTLWDMGLLESSEPERYMLHQTVREYAQQQQPNDEGQRRFVSYMMGYIHTHQREYVVLERELLSIEEALKMAHTLEMSQELLAGLRDAMSFFQARGLYSMAEHYLWYGWEAVSNQGDAKEQAIVANHLASTLCKLGNYAQAKEIAVQGLALTSALDEKQVRSRLLQTLGDIADNEGDRARAEGYYREGLQLARQTQDTFLLCSLSFYCGKIAW